MNKRSLLLILLLVMVASMPAAAQLRLGVRGGLTVNKLHFDRDIIDSSNRLGYSVGLVLDAGIPVVGIGIEASAMYTHRNNRLSDHDRIYKRHYLDIPLYARYRLTIPGAAHYVAPVIFTGPDFSILFDEDKPGDNVTGRRTYMSWDVGGGVDLFNHLRLTVTYGIGMSKALKVVNREYNGDIVNGKDKHWTLSAAWLF